MKATKSVRHTTQWYTLSDGPIVLTDPVANMSVHGQFRVELMTVSWTDGELNEVFVRGQSVRKDGTDGKRRHSRSYYRDYPQWMEEFLDISV